MVAKKRKKLAILLSSILVLLIAVVVGIFLMKTVFYNPYEISKTSMQLELFTTQRLTVTDAEGHEVNADWKSNNACVEVDQRGNLTGKSVGTAKVTAKIGKKRVACDVTVSVPEGKGAMLQLNREDVELMVGNSITIKASLIYDGTEVDVPQLSVKTDGSKVSATVSGDSVILTGVAETDKIPVTVGCSWNGFEIVDTIDVSVTGDVIVRLSSSWLDLYTYQYKDFHVEDTLSVLQVFIEDVEQKSWDISWKVLDEKIVSFKNGKVKALAEGETDIVATLVHDGKAYEAYCHVIVAKTQIDLTDLQKQEIVLDKANRGGTLYIGLYDVLRNFGGKLVVDDLTGNAHEIAAKRSGNILTISKGLLGAEQKNIAIKSEKFDVIVSVAVVNLEISTAKDLKNLAKYADKDYFQASYSGYFKLVNNIDFGETKVQAKGVWDDYFKGFTGVFDGCGYTIDGGLYGPGGLFGVIGKGGEVKNLAIINAGIGVDVFDEFGKNNNWYPGILAGEIHGKVTDVLIELCYRELGWYSGSKSGADGAVMGFDLSDSELTRVVVSHGKCPGGKEPTYMEFFAYMGNNVKLTDVYYEGYSQLADLGDNNFFAYSGTREGRIIGITTDENLDWMTTKENFGSIWYLKGQTPQFVSHCKPVTDLNYEYLLYTSISGGKRVPNTQSLKINLKSKGYTNKAYVRIHGKLQQKGISISGGVLTVSSDVLRKLGSGTQALQVSKTKDGQAIFVAVTNYSAYLSTAQDIKNLVKYVDKDDASATYQGYFKLLNNIDLGETKIQAKGVWDGYENGFSGVFDGCGFTIEGGLYGPGGLFGVISSSGEVKNLAITNAGIGLDIFDKFAKNGGWYPGILAGATHGKLTDVLIELCYRSIGWYTGSQSGVDGSVMGFDLSYAELTRVVITHGKCPTGKEPTYMEWFAYTGNNVKLTDVYFESYSKLEDLGDNNFFVYSGNREGKIIGITTDDNLDWMTNKKNFGNIWYLKGNTPQFVSHCIPVTDINYDYLLYTSISGGKRVPNTASLKINLKSKGYTNQAYVRIHGQLQQKGISISDGVLTVSSDILEKLGSGIHALQVSKTKNGQAIFVGVTNYSAYLSTAKDIKNLAQYVDKDTTSATYQGYFKLLNNIDLGETKIQAKGVWDGYENGFVGVFDGCGYTITGGLYGPGGLFGVISGGGEVKNLAITNAGIGLDGYDTFANNGGWYPGILAGATHGKVTDVLMELRYRTLGWYSGLQSGADGSVMGFDLSDAELTRVVVTHGKCPTGKEPTYMEWFAYTGNNVKLTDVYFESYSKLEDLGDNNFFVYSGNREGKIIGITTDDNLDWMTTKHNFGYIWYLKGQTPQFISHCTPVPDISQDYVLYTKISGGERVANTQKVKINLKSKGYTNKAYVRINGKLQEKGISISGGVLTVDSEILAKLGSGTHALQVSKTKDGYSIFVGITNYSAYLSTQQDLMDIPKYVDKNDSAATYQGYFKLLNNIKLGETVIQAKGVWDGYENGFVGVFDGCGYTIEGGLYGPGGLFGVISDGGEVKNLAIKNAGIGVDGFNEFANNGGWYPGILAGATHGKVTDVLMELCYRKYGWYSGTSGADGAAMGIDLSDAELTRVVVTHGKCPAGKEPTYMEFFAYTGDNTKLTDVYFESYSQLSDFGENNFFAYTGVREGKIVGITTDENLDWMTTKNNFGYVWYLKGKTPQFVSHCTPTADISKDYVLYTSILDGNRIENTQSIQIDLKSKDYTNLAYVRIHGKLQEEGISIADGLLTVSSKILTELGPGTHGLQVSKTKDGQSIFVGITNYSAYLSTEQDILNLSKYVDKDATTATYNGYFKLLNNINLGERVIQAKGIWDGYENGFVGVFDGCGYTINGGLYGPGGLFGVIGDGGEVKNLAIRNAGIGVDAFDEFANNGGWYPGTLAGTIKGKVTDVLIELCYRMYDWYQGNSKGADGAAMGIDLSDAELTRVIVTHGECPAGKEPTYMDYFAYTGNNVKLVDVYYEGYSKLPDVEPNNFFAYAGTREGEIVGITTDDNLNWLTTKDHFGDIWYLDGDAPQFSSSRVVSADAIKQQDYALYTSVKDGTRVVNTQSITYDFAQYGFSDNVVIKSGGNDISDYATLQDGKITISAENLKKLGAGSHQLEISNGEDVSAKVTINIYTAILSKEQDVKDFSKYVDKDADAKTYGGSFKLANNINLGEIKIQAEGTWDGYENGFTGVFDGCGYTIDGGEYGPGGLFGTIGSGGEVKNLAIIGAGLGVDHNDEFAIHGGWYPGILAGSIYGKVTDVMVELCHRITDWYPGNKSGIDGAAMGGAISNAELTRVVVTHAEYSAAERCPHGKETTYMGLFAYWGTDIKLRDVYYENWWKYSNDVIANAGYPNYLLYNSNVDGQVVGITTDDNLDWMTGKDNFGNIWYLKGKTPQFVSHCIPVADVRQDYELYSSISGGKRVANTQSANIDLKSYGYTNQAFVRMQGTLQEKGFSITDGVLSVSSEVLQKLGTGKHSLQISKTENGQSIFVEITNYLAYLSSAQDLKNLAKYANKDSSADTYGGYFKLTNNINVGDEIIQAKGVWDGYENGFTGVFDGCGYTINGGQYGPGGLFGVIGNGGEVKNLAITNAGIGVDSFDEFTNNGGWYPGTLAGAIHGKVTDVLIELDYRVYDWYTGAPKGADGAALAIDLSNAELTRVVVTHGTCPTGKEPTYMDYFAYMGSDVKLVDVYFEGYSKNADLGNYNFFAYNGTREGKIVGITTDENLDWMTTKNHFGDIWYLDGNTPKFVSSK